MRTADVQRNTAETQIYVKIGLDGTGARELDSGIPFLDHMLDQIARHGLVDLTIRAKGDLDIDAHHTVEDIGNAVVFLVSDNAMNITGQTLMVDGGMVKV